MKTAVEWFNQQLVDRQNGNGDFRSLDEIFEQAKEMEQKQRQPLLSYIQEVRDVCVKLRFPTEEELRELTIKADVILETFKQQEQ